MLLRAVFFSWLIISLFVLEWYFHGNITNWVLHWRRQTYQASCISDAWFLLEEANLSGLSKILSVLDFMIHCKLSFFPTFHNAPVTPFACLMLCPLFRFHLLPYSTIFWSYSSGVLELPCRHWSPKILFFFSSLFPGSQIHPLFTLVQILAMPHHLLFGIPGTPRIIQKGLLSSCILFVSRLLAYLLMMSIG